tara:strand:+ start:331 stop:591 length:261 start_codon:yes stop_codon:yes gene_type:complete
MRFLGNFAHLGDSAQNLVDSYRKASEALAQYPNKKSSDDLKKLARDFWSKLEGSCKEWGIEVEQRVDEKLIAEVKQILQESGDPTA